MPPPSTPTHPTPLQATFVSVAAAASLGTGSPSGLALVLGVPSVGIFLVGGVVVEDWEWVGGKPCSAKVTWQGSGGT